MPRLQRSPLVARAEEWLRRRYSVRADGCIEALPLELATVMASFVADELRVAKSKNAKD